MPTPTLDLQSTGTFWQGAARTIPVTADGQSIGAWDDATAGAHHVTEATNKPTYKTNQINGLPAVDFDGTGVRLGNSANFLGGQYGSIFIVIKVRTNGLLLSVRDSTDEGIRFEAYVYNDVCYSDFYGGDAGNELSVSSLGSGWRLYELHSDGSSYQNLLDGTDVTNVVDGANNGKWLSNLTSANLIVEIGVVGAATDPLDGQIAAVKIFYGVALTDGEKATVRSQLANKYGITGSGLPDPSLVGRPAGVFYRIPTHSDPGNQRPDHPDNGLRRRP